MKSGSWGSEEVTDDGSEHAQSVHVFTSGTNTEPSSWDLGEDVPHKEGTEDVATESPVPLKLTLCQKY